MERPSFNIELSLSDYWAVVRKRHWAVTTVAVAVFAAAVTYTRVKKPVYRSIAILKFEIAMPSATSASAGSISQMSPMVIGPMIQTQVSLLNSIDMMERVSRKTDIPAEKLASAASATRVAQTNLIQVVAKSTDPLVASNLVNTFAATMIEWDLEVRSRQARQSLADVATRADVAQAAMDELQQQRKTHLESHKATGMTAALATRLVELESSREELLRKFTEQHPQVISLDKRIKVTRAKLSAQPAAELQLAEIERELRIKEETFLVLSRQMEELRLQLASTVSFLSIVSPGAPPDAPFIPKVGLCYALGLFGGLFFGVFAAFVLENLDISITTIEEIEKVLEAPVLGIVPHFGSESKWHDILTTVFKKDRHPEEAFRSFLLFQHNAHSPVIEVYHNLRVNIQAQLSKPGGMVLAFTSTGVAEGKTMTSTNFALAAAHSGLKTLLIAADIRRPSLHKIFGLPREPGLIEAVSGRVPWEKTLRGTLDFLMGEKYLERLAAFPGIDNLRIMTGWTASTAEVVNLFSSRRLVNLIEEMRSKFDIVIFDCPPVLLFVDAMLIGQHTDGTVLIYKSGKMARRALKRARDQIVMSHGKILGIVLNDARATDMEPGYGYYSDYGHYAKPQAKS